MIPKSLHQLSDTVLMIEPVQFGFNHEASETNSFQNMPTSEEEKGIQTKALAEFNRFVEQLEQLSVNVIVYRDTVDSFTPDSIFPNNWISTHETGELFTYPMAVSNRRNERRMDIVTDLCSQFSLKHIDLSHWENETPPRFLEGTGGMIFDRTHRICYAAVSPRAHLSALEEFCAMNQMDLVSFEAYGKNREAIYHTNVMLSVGDSFVCIGTDTIAPNDRERVRAVINSTGKELIEFTNDQIYHHFAGNMLQIRNVKGEKILVLSERIFQHLTSHQKSRLEQHNDHLLPISIPTIETIGGGSVRCMLAELFYRN